MITNLRMELFETLVGSCTDLELEREAGLLPREPRDTLELDLCPAPDLGTATRAAPALETAV